MLPITLQEMKYGLSGTIHEGHHWPDVSGAAIVCVCVRVVCMCVEKLVVLSQTVAYP